MSRDLGGLRVVKKPIGSNTKSNDIVNDEPKLSENHECDYELEEKIVEDDNDEAVNNSPVKPSYYETPKFKITVPVAPRFTCGERLERRKEFYSKLEEKHRALEKERLEHEARLKEEEEAAIKQLRKSLVYKANPLPEFYREVPPPKTKARKLQLSRSKSSNVNKYDEDRICA